ncbi:MAG: PAS domain-containing protein [Methanospirillum sp.]|uniref:PAS domain-containing protein n=1 Tax=Methanospirillum sp. TaxID=45200 RepID=UPI002372DE16|nr:PAS domain-containing protein [Methanospirillum sp.]MDD1730369.1 PAS domain-containing protein [Methanospirillum sp.]
MVWDSEYQITRINHACELLIGRSEQEVKGALLSILFPTDWTERSMNLIHTTHEGVKWETVEIPIVHQNGTVRSVLWNSATITDPGGTKPIATIAQGRDISVEKSLMQEKERAIVQIQENIAKLAILNDGIRNPLTIIEALIEMEGGDQLSASVKTQIIRIDEMVTTLDREWVKSVKILDYLRRHNEICSHFIRNER